jgi:hypothetical protein
MKTGILFLLLLTLLYTSYNAREFAGKQVTTESTKVHAVAGERTISSDPTEKLKFVILCFRLSPPYDDEIAALNQLADEYKAYVSPVVIRDEDLTKYKELFTRTEFKSLEDYILNKTAYQKLSTSFPVILILDKNGQVKHAWSGDKSDGLKREEFYTRIKAGLQAIAKGE